MSWQSPYLTQRRDPTRGIQKGLAFAKELEKEGLEVGSEEWNRAVGGYLEQETTERCRCGRVLRVFELGAEMCRPCQEAWETLKENQNGAREVRMNRIGVPPGLQHMTFESWRGDVPAELDDFVAKPQGTLLLAGAGTGTGKTHLATAALYSIHVGGRRCLWISAAVLAKRLADEVFADVKETDRRAIAVEVLLVDDLGGEQGVVPRARELVNDILHQRYNHGRATIVTSNLLHLEGGEPNAEKLIAYDARTASRLLDAAGAVVFRDGVDERWRP